MRPGIAWVDVDEVMRATTSQPASLSLLDGDLLEDLDGIDPTFDAWLATERERLRDRARSIAEALLREQADPEAAIPAAQRLLQIDRAHEGAWRALMRAYVGPRRARHGDPGLRPLPGGPGGLLDTAPSQETQKLLAEIRGPYGSRIPPAAVPSRRCAAGRRAPAADSRGRRAAARSPSRGPTPARRAAASMSACCRCSWSA